MQWLRFSARRLLVRQYTSSHFKILWFWLVFADFLSPCFFLQITGLNPCHSSPCLNNGSCERINWTYNCVCSERFSGSNCELGELDLTRRRPGCLKLCKRVNADKKLKFEPRPVQKFEPGLRAAKNFFPLKGLTLYFPLRHHLGWTKQNFWLDITIPLYFIYSIFK